MTIFRLLFKEISRRLGVFLLALLAVSAAVALFVWSAADAKMKEDMALQLEEEAKVRKDNARKTGLKMGYNLRILPAKLNLNDYWGRPDVMASHDMPEDYVVQITKMEDIVADHFLATLEQWEPYEGGMALVTGIRKELGVEGRKKKKTMFKAITPGTVYVGYGIALEKKIRQGSKIKIRDKEFLVKRLLKEKGSRDDHRMYLDLNDMQELFNRQGKINVIEALGCKCSSGELLKVIRGQLQERLPGTQVIEKDSIARAREKMRKDADEALANMVSARKAEEKKNYVRLGVVMGGAGIFIGVLFYLNVRGRRREIGILRAVGVDGGRIAGLFFGKALFIGLLGAAIGFAIGVGLTYQLGDYQMNVVGIDLKSEVGMNFLMPMLPWCFGVAPAIALLSGLVPTLQAVTMDPSVALHEE